MRNRRNCAISGGLTVLCGLILSGAAIGQNAPAAPSTSTPAPKIQQIVVTATHFATLLNNTPLSISAVTRSSLLQRGIVNFSDLIGPVPSLQITGQTGTGLANIAIRGIVQNGPGAATTGFYLNNTPLQAWNTALTAGASDNGTPLPPIFDLERVEVLKGPQGTLFGASSEGGTIRYITPQPSLRHWHIYAKVDTSRTDYANGINYSPGVAVGGPIIPGVLGFRSSIYMSHQAGWIQMEDPLTRSIIGKGLNSTDVQETHNALTWNPTENLSATASWFYSYQSTPYSSSTYDLSVPYQITAPALGFNTTGITPAHRQINPPTVCGGFGQVACSAYTGTTTYIRPAASWGPFPLPRYTALNEYPSLNSPASTAINIPSLDLTYSFPGFTASLYSSLVRQISHSTTVSYAEMSVSTFDMSVVGTPYVIREGWNWPQNYPELGYDDFETTNYRNSWAEDLRFTSNLGPATMRAGVLSWTVGVYYEDDWDHDWFVNVQPTGTLDGNSQALYGITGAERWGSPALPTANAALENFATFSEHLSSTNAAVYAQANYNITDHLQLTAGARESIVTFSFDSLHYGPVSGTTAATASAANGALLGGSSEQHPFTPLGEVTYRFTPDKMAYVMASEGFRPGGANTPLPEGQCQRGAALFGLTVNDLPKTYGPDSDWNLELGTKLGLDNGRVQVNADAYHILWSNVQTSQAPGGGCGDEFTANAGHAVSEGFELSAQAIVARALSLEGSFGYDHAYYTENAIAIHGAPGFPNLVVAFAGENFNLPPWTADVGARLDLASLFGTGGNYDPYVRADWHDSAGYGPLSRYPLGNFAPDVNSQPAISELNVRAGVTTGPVDVNLYAINALNSDTGIMAGGRSGCFNAACSAYLSYNPIFSVSPPNPPLTVGLQFTYSD